jgi:hypothetical protein
MPIEMKNNFEIPALNRNGKDAILTLHTHKGGRGGIYSYAQVQYREGPFLSFEMFGDFRKVVANNQTARATAKAIETQHAAAFTPEVKAALIVEALAFYAAKAAKDATR